MASSAYFEQGGKCRQGNQISGDKVWRESMISPRPKLRGARRTIPPNDTSAEPARCQPAGMLLPGRMLGFTFDLVDGVHHRVESQQSGGMPGMVITYRLQYLQIGPFAFGRRAVVLQHFPHFGTDLPQLLCGRADYVARHDRGGRLPQGASPHFMGKIDDFAALHGQVDGDRGAAELGMGGCRGIGRLQPSLPGNIPRQLQDPPVINFVEHVFLLPGRAGQLQDTIRNKYSIGLVREEGVSPGSASNPDHIRAGVEWIFMRWARSLKRNAGDAPSAMRSGRSNGEIVYGCGCKEFSAR